MDPENVSGGTNRKIPAKAYPGAILPRQGSIPS
jgi:hypothetical protein